MGGWTTRLIFTVVKMLISTFLGQKSNADNFHLVYSGSNIWFFMLFLSTRPYCYWFVRSHRPLHQRMHRKLSLNVLI